MSTAHCPKQDEPLVARRVSSAALELNSTASGGRDGGRDHGNFSPCSLARAPSVELLLTEEGESVLDTGQAGCTMPARSTRHKPREAGDGEAFGGVEA